MLRTDAINMLKDIVNEIDYDIYKNLFIEGCMEDPEQSLANQESLLRTINTYVGIED